MGTANTASRSSHAPAPRRVMSMVFASRPRVFIPASARRASILIVGPIGCSTKAVDRQFDVLVDKEKAWAFLERVEEWPDWAPHIETVDVSTPDRLDQHTEGTFLLANGMTSTFKMTEFNPPTTWMWPSPF